MRIKLWRLFVSWTLIFVAGFISGAFLYQHFTPQTCYSGQFMVPHPMMGAMIAGDIQVCGQGLGVGIMTGPPAKRGVVY